MQRGQRLSAALILAAAVIFALPGYSFAETRAALLIAAADTPATPPPAATPPEPATPPSDKAAGNPAADKPALEKSGAAPVGKAVFPSAVDPKYSHELGPLARMRTCADQFTANKATNANGGMKWIDRSGGYYLACSKLLKK